MSEEFGQSSSVKILEWLTHYKKLSVRPTDSLSETDKSKLKELELKLASFLAKTSGKNVPPPNARTSLRVNTNYSIRLGTIGEFHKAYMKNVSGGGLFVETDKFEEIGTRVKLQVVLPETTQAVEFETEVAWINPRRTASTPQGLGLKFVNLSEANRSRIQRLVNTALDRQIKGAPKKP
jgi:uncharacterized protein (TIGR02266 family)